MSIPPAANAVSPRIMSGINFIGLKTFIHKETSRFLNVYMQTLIAPLVTLFLFFTVFALSLGAHDRVILGVSYIDFLAPGLLMMTMIQNSFSNSSSSITIAKVQGNIVDVLMPPLSSGEILAGYAIGSMIRGLAIGLIGACALFLVLDLQIHFLWMVIVYAVLGNLMLGLMGILGGLWSEKFDHLAAVTNFIITPMTFLSGTFYAYDTLPEIWQKIALLNPFFYMIDGFRAGFIGVAEANVMHGLLLLAGLNILLVAMAWRMLSTGYKIKS